MTPLDLGRDPIAALVRARPPQAQTIVWVHIPARRAWCVLRSAEHGGLVRTLCSDEQQVDTLHILTSAADRAGRRGPVNTCPACETELAAGTPGAAIALDHDDLALARAPTPQVSRTETANLRGSRRPGSDPPDAWDRQAWDPDSREIKL